MPLSTANGPAGGASAVAKALEHLMPQATIAGGPPLGGAVAPLTASQPIPTYNMALNDIKDENFLLSAAQTGWRYLIGQDEPVGVADCGVSGAGAPAFKSLIRGEIGYRLRQAASYAASNYAGDPSTFEVRVLDIPALYSSALWLHGPKDVFIPFLHGGAGACLPAEDPDYIKRMVRLATDKRAARQGQVP